MSLDGTGQGKSSTYTFWVTEEALTAMKSVSFTPDAASWPTKPDETGYYPISLTADVAMKLIPTRDPEELSQVIIVAVQNLNN